MKNIFKKVIIANIFAFTAIYISAQDYNPLQYSVSSLTIAPDARGGGMGDAGVATAPDVYSQYWNPAKYAFSPSKAGLGLSYTPWLRKVVNEIALMNAVGYYKLGSDDNQALSASIRYFTIGDVNINDNWGNNMGTVSPHEMAIDLGYSRKLTSTFSLSVVGRFIYADYSAMDEDTSSASTWAADVAGYNESYINIGQSESLLSFGFNISNIGGKLDNPDGQTSSFIPTNLRVGTSLMYPVSDVSTLSLSVDANKMLIPTPPLDKDQDSKEYKDYINTSSLSGIFKSFGDAPGGFSEEIKEIMWSVGAEYNYDRKFSIRTGYFHENKMKGNRQYLSFGAGFKMSAFQLDAAYMVSTVSQSPLDQTLRFSLAFDLEGLKNLMN